MEYEEARHDQEYLERVVTQVREHLESEEAPVTLRNVVQAMFDINYADWLGGSSIYPECKYEKGPTSLLVINKPLIGEIMRLIANLVRRVRLRILALRIRILNLRIAFRVVRQTQRARRTNLLINRVSRLVSKRLTIKVALVGSAE